MEDADLVSKVALDSPRGPQRKEYTLKKSFSITIDLAPNLFRARMFSFGAVPGLGDAEERAQTSAQPTGVLRYPEGASRIRPLTRVVAEVDKKLKLMEEERAVLLYIRSLAIREAARISTSIPAGDRKRVLRYIMREEGEGIAGISASLGLQREAVSEILDEIERELAGSD